MGHFSLQADATEWVPLALRGDELEPVLMIYLIRKLFQVGRDVRDWRLLALKIILTPVCSACCARLLCPELIRYKLRAKCFWRHADSAGARTADTPRESAAAPGGRQDFLIPRAGNQLLRSRAGTVSIYSYVGGIALRGRRLVGPKEK